MGPRRVVVVGASLAGVNAVQALRESGYDGELTLVGEESVGPYDRPPLSKEALLEGPAPGDLALRTEDFYRGADMGMLLGRRAVRLDPCAGRLLLDDGSDIGYEGLVIATGAVPRWLPGCAHLAGVHVLRSIQDCAALHEDLAPGRKLVVVGAGFVGLEVAATARSLGVDVTVLEAASAPLVAVLGAEAGRWLAERHVAEGVEIHCGLGAKGIEGGAGGLKVRCTDGSLFPADAVVLGLGVAPRTDWLDGSGVEVGDGVRCDSSCRTNVPGVVAAGDVARWYNPLFDEQMRIEHWTNAVEHGRAAALNLLRWDAPVPYAPVPYFWSDQFSARIRFVGRSFAATQMTVVERDDTKGSLVVLYGRDGLLRGALAINAPRAMVTYRRLIAERASWADVVRG